LTQVSFLLSVSNNVPELRKSLETTKATLLSLHRLHFFLFVVFRRRLRFLKVEIQKWEAKQKQEEEEEEEEEEEKANKNQATHTKDFERSETARLSGCNNIQGTESFKKDFLIHVICVCVCVEKR
jgi:C4-dicarboxylate-specific signal transduction histidine kinase